MLKRWMGTCRFTYNKALAYTREHVHHKKSFYWMRNRFVNKSNVSFRERFLLETPKHVREAAVKDLSVAFSANFSKKRNGSIDRFQIRFRTKREHQSMLIPKAAFKPCEAGHLSFYPRFLKSPIRLSQTKKRIPLPEHDCRLTFDGRSWVLCVPVDQEVKQRSKPSDRDDVCAIDPGVRTFITTWSPRRVTKIGDGVATEMFQRMILMDKLRSKIDTCKNRRSKSRTKRAFLRLSERFQNIQRDLHYKSAHELTNRYDHIVLPRFGSKRMSKKTDRSLKTKTVRSMSALAHYKFQTRLSDVAKRKGVTVHLCTEEYTSKTCSRCGNLNERLGSKKKFECPNCSFRCDRDVQGAFNILIKFLKPFTFPEDSLPGGHPR